ncbi:thioredoxin domain-containing protein [Desulfopila sp. IMCC35006]|uniref:thioredoxin domain-containing protein n=1 Tax=Desulfopila sp. IMCC35006 TaxID=2569542 RepID=UPI001F105B6E|nr:thioredoxin domain-containing protein [Desulfopila sp. IMCC35006]
MFWIIIAGLTISLLPIMVLSASANNSGNRIHQQVQKRLAAGERANRLIDEQSPYLLQHAFNPVDWYPWGDEAFARAKKEDKPIFLSIGYSTCHWCHVMAHESFENPAIAAILNQWFVSIKVDREERPDIDQMYMAATQAMTGSGGWPMSVFLLPDASPFYAGTYFPPLSVSSNRPGFKDLLTTIHQVWLEQKGELQDSATRMVAALERRNAASPAAIQSDVFQRGFSLLEQNYDPREGGFGQAPKFPRPVVLAFLFSHYKATGEKKAKDMALFTLRKMAEGGMHDQLGGGFHRYSVDDHWFVPHFEKMLYDQPQLANAYLDAYQITRDEVYARTAKEIFTYLLRDMRDAAGGFYSAEDADSDNPYSPGQHGEGAFYLWTKEDIVKRLGAQAAAIFTRGFGIKKNGNVQQDPMAEFTGRNILYWATTDEALAAELKMATEYIIESIAASRELLFKAREQRKRPHLDDKVITAWNGMVIGALARSSRILQDPQFLTASLQTATFIKEHLCDDTSRNLLRRYRNKQAGLAGQLSDYAYLVDGLLELYRASHDPQWLSWSVDLTERQIELFWHETGGFFFDGAADPSIKIRMRGSSDGAEPSGNSVATHNLLRLAQLHNAPQWQQMARRLVESFSDVINDYPPALPLMLTAWQHINAKPSQIVIAGKPGADDTEALLRVVDSTFSEPRLLLFADGGQNQAYLARKLPFMESVAPLGGKATAYVCSDFTCTMPVTDPITLQRQLEENKKNP